MDRTNQVWTRSSAVGAIGRRRPMFGTARARRRLLPVVALAVLVGVPALLAVVIDRGSPPASAEEARPVEVAPPVDGAAAAATAAPGDVALPPLLASHDGLELRLPSDDPVVVGFHEASQSAALPMHPIGTIRDNANTTRFVAPPDREDGAEYVVMSSRGRAPAATSAVDVVLRDDDPVLSPVDGTVTDVRAYHLYGKYPDHRIEITPLGRPGLRIVLIHVRDVSVAVGDTVEAGLTPLAASANRFPFGSHIDRYTEPDRWPHVHMEVKRPAAE